MAFHNHFPNIDMGKTDLTSTVKRQTNMKVIEHDCVEEISLTGTFTTRKERMEQFLYRYKKNVATTVAERSD
jgi:hypothetical protein